MKRLLFVLIVALAWAGAVAQDDVAFTNYWSFQSFYNPAAAGVDKQLDIKAAFRIEMMGFEDSGRTFLVQADAPLWFLSSPRHGGGVGFMNDKIGLFSNKRIWLQYAYHQPVRKVNRLSLGVRFAFIADGFDGGKVETGESGGSSDPVLPTGNVTGSGFDLDLGLRFSHKDIWYAGIAVTHVLAPTVRLGDEKIYQIRVPRTLYAMGGHTLRFNRPEFSLRTAAMFRSEFKTWRGDISARFCYDGVKGKMYGGINYSPTISVALLFGFDFHGVNLGYSYEMYTGGIAIQNGSHEIHLGYRMDMNFAKRGKNMHQSVRWL